MNDGDTEIYDFAVVGGGSGGYAGARTAASLGLKTVVIDGAAELGGLCILRGCMPSKALIETANVNMAVRSASRFGITVPPSTVDSHFVRERKRTLIADFAGYRQGQLSDGRFDLMRGWAAFEKSEDKDSPARLKVTLADGTTQQVLAKTVLIATGSTIQIPPLEGLKETGYWDSDIALDEADIPESFVVLGGGSIALEMAHYLHGIGRKVTVIQRSSHLLKELDKDASSVIAEAFEKRGIEIYTDTKIERIEKSSTGKQVTFRQAGKDEPEQVEAAEILVALGRAPATKGLGLESAGIDSDKSGLVIVGLTQQSASDPRVFAAGDVCGPLEVVHLAAQQGEVAAKNAALHLAGKELTHTMDYRCKLFAIFTEPQAAVVGLSEAEAKEKGIPYIVASYPFNDHGKSMIMDAMDGFVKLLADPKSGKLLGGCVVGPEASELIHEISVAMHLNATAEQLATAPHYHPTLSEIWTYPAEELSDAVHER